MEESKWGGKEEMFFEHKLTLLKRQREHTEIPLNGPFQDFLIIVSYSGDACSLEILLNPFGYKKCLEFRSIFWNIV